MTDLQTRLKQSKPFESLEVEAALNIAAVSQRIYDHVGDLFKSVDLSPPQYNALRILRGAGKEGRTCNEIGERMLNRVPDVTRLLDRLEARGLVSRCRETTDRRVVRVWITEAGLRLIAGLDAPLIGLHKRNLGHMGEKKLRQLISLLEEAYSGVAGE